MICFKTQKICVEGRHIKTMQQYCIKLNLRSEYNTHVNYNKEYYAYQNSLD